MFHISSILKYISKVQKLINIDYPNYGPQPIKMNLLEASLQNI